MSMSEQAALLAAIVAYSDEDTPRLIYADWLDENGDPIRAEFIRLQVELERRSIPKVWTDDLRVKFRRFRELIVNYADEWAYDLGIPRTRATFRRGFIEEVVCTHDELPHPNNPALLREPVSALCVSRDLRLPTQPIPGLHILERLAAWPVPGRFRRLYLYDLFISRDALLTLLSSPAMANVRELDLSGNRLEADAIEAFIECPELPELHSVTVGRLELTPGQGQALARARNLPKLTQLRLSISTIPREAEDATPDPMAPVIAELRNRYSGVWY